MADLKTREKRRLLRQKALLKKQSVEDMEDTGFDEEVAALDTPEIVEEVEKSYGEEIYPGPTTWEEMDSERRIREQALKVEETNWNASRLVNNVIRDTDMLPEQKSKALADIGNGFGERLKSIMPDKMEKSVGEDAELVELQTIIAIDRRTASGYEKLKDWLILSKASMSSSELPDDAFALVYETDSGKVRKYPINDKSHIRKSLSHVSQMIEKGGEDEKFAREAMPVVKQAARKLSIGMDMAPNSIVIEKDADGKWRAVLWASNNFKDRDGEIISDVAHREYVEWVNKNMDVAPVFMTWHIPGTARQNQIDFVGYENGFVIMSAPVTDGEAVQLMKMQQNVNIGLSIGGFAIERDPLSRNVITKYRMYEVSDLPLERAANPFTEFQVIKKEADVDTLQYLTQILGDENKAKTYIEKAGIKQVELRKAGIEEKEAKPGDPEASDEAIEEVVAKAEVPALDEIVARVAKEFGMAELSAQFALIKEQAEKVPVLESLVKELAASRDDKLAEMISPPAGATFAWLEKRASQSAETILDEKNDKDAKLKKARPEFWLSEATGTEPVGVQ